MAEGLTHLDQPLVDRGGEGFIFRYRTSSCTSKMIKGSMDVFVTFGYGVQGVVAGGTGLC